MIQSDVCDGCSTYKSNANEATMNYYYYYSLFRDNVVIDLRASEWVSKAMEHLNRPAYCNKSHEVTKGQSEAAQHEFEESID